MEVDGEEEVFVEVFGDHGVSALGVEENGGGEVSDDAVDGDGGGGGLGVDEADEMFDNCCNILEIAVGFFGLEEEGGEHFVAAEVEGDVENALPVDVAADVAEAGAELVDEAAEAGEGGIIEGRVNVQFKIFAVGAEDLGGLVFGVADLAAEEFGDEVTGGEVDGAEVGEVFVVVGAEAPVAEAVVEFLFHAAFGFDAFEGVVEEVFVEGDGGVFVPPGGVEDDFDGEGGGVHCMFFLRVDELSEL
jgi:hypothetical protein